MIPRQQPLVLRWMGIIKDTITIESEDQTLTKTTYCNSANKENLGVKRIIIR